MLSADEFVVVNFRPRRFHTASTATPKVLPEHPETPTPDRTPESPLRGISSENAPNIRINFWPILVILIRISRVT